MKETTPFGRAIAYWGLYLDCDTDRENRATRTVLLVRKVIVGIAIALSNDARESGFVQAALSETMRRGGPCAVKSSPGSRIRTNNDPRIEEVEIRGGRKLALSHFVGRYQLISAAVSPGPLQSPADYAAQVGSRTGRAGLPLPSPH